MYVVVNVHGFAFAGVSSISGRPMWFKLDDNVLLLEGVAKFKRDGRWLKIALNYDATSTWQEV